LHRRADPDAVIENEYELYKPEVMRSLRGKLAASKIRFSELDLDAFYNQAWHSVYVKIANGEEVDNRRGMLVTIAHRRAVDEYRLLHPDRFDDVTELETLGVSAGSGESDVDALLDDRIQLKQFMQSLRGELSERELQAAGLCYVYGYTRPEAAKVLGVRASRMEKIMDSVSKKITPMVGEIKAGKWCESHASLINAYALGMLDDDTERYSLAVEHLRDCSACRRDVLRKRGIASVVAPLPFLIALGKAGAIAGVGSAATAGVAAGHAAGSGGAGATGTTGAAAAGGGVSGASIAAVAATVAAVSVLTAAMTISPHSAPPQKSSDIAAIAKTPAAVASAPVKKAAVKHKVHKAHKATRKPHKQHRTVVAQPVQPVVQTPLQTPTPTPTPAPQSAPQHVQQHSPSSTSDGAGEFDLK
jgi:DNA-directed RNA polymerase specialized sigma24 family protein